MSESIRQSNLFAGEDYKKVFKAYQFIDYTAYDFDTLKQALINYIQTYYPEDFNDYIESSEFIAIVELLAYFGTSLAFRTDLNSRENFIDTAERRESIIRLAQMVNYVPRRNVAASGLFKIAAVQTDQPLTDANGVNINDVTVFWNDPNNSNWFDQFVQICNASFSTLNPFGRPTKSGKIGSIPTDLYQLNNVLRLNVTYPTTVTINGQQFPIDVCNPDFVTNQTIFERDPDPANAFNFIYRNDSLGVSSSNTGFFLFFKQGNLINVDTNFDFPVPNRLFPIDIQNINQDDVYVQETDQTGNVINKWVKVPALAGENIIYNSIHNSQRNIYDVITGANDTITVRFADGNFGNVPTGLFRTWIRTSANQSLVIRPDDAQGLQINIPYIGVDQQQYTLRVIFNLEQTIGNAAPSETNEQIKLRAPEVFSTQSRMVNGSDYNVLPLVFGNQIAKIQAVDRTYSGQSRYIDLADPTGFHHDLLIFGQDGALYRDNQNVLVEVVKDASSIGGTIETIMIDTIQEMLRDPKVMNFFYDEYLSQFETTVQVNRNVGGFGRSLLNLVPITIPITSIGGNGAVVTIGYVGRGLPVGSTIVVSGVTGQPAYNGTYTVLTTAVNSVTVSSAVVGTGITLNAIISTDPSLPLYWGTSPSRFKNITGYFATTPVSTSNDAVSLINTLDPVNDPYSVYQAWGLIKDGSILQFQLPDGTVQTTSVNTVVQDGNPIYINPLNPYATVGPVELSSEVQAGLQALKVYPPFRNALTPAEINGDLPNGIYGIVNRITDGISFWLYYDLLQDQWNTSTTSTPGIADQSQQPFVYAPTNPNSIYSSWANYPNSGLLYINIVQNPQLGTTTYSLTERGRVYIFESYRDVRFFWEPNQVVIDNATGRALKDLIEIMPFVNTNKLVNNNTPPLPAAMPVGPYLKAPLNFNISGVFTQDDGYLDPAKVKVSLIDKNGDGIPDDPSGFDRVVTHSDRIVFEYYNNEVSGYQSTRPWISRWGIDLQDWTGSVYVYFPTDPATGFTSLYGSPYITNIPVIDPYNPTGTPSAIVVYMDQYDLVFINNNAQLLSIATQVTAFFNDTVGLTGNVRNKIDIVTNNFINKSFLLSPTPPGFGVYNLFEFQTTSDIVTYPAGQKIVSALDKYHFDKNGKIFTQNESVLPAYRIPFYFKWSHYSPLDQRIDPSPSNIIDQVVITDSYYRDMLIWKNTNGTAANMPLAPTTEELRIQFQSLDQYKMVSDSMIWNSGVFKILFGTQAETELQATFKVVKAPSTSISDNEVKTKVIQAIDTYFDIRNWDFGEKFFYTELAAFIHQQLSRIISSVVIVPNTATSQFGNLFEIVAGPNQLFMSTATVNNVQIVTNLTDQNLRV